MKHVKRLIPHGAWVVVAIGTFALGFVVASSRHAPDGSGSPDGVQTAPSVVAAPIVGAGTSITERVQGATDDGAAGGEASRSSRPLTPFQIENLAREAFTDASQLKRSLAFSKLLESLTPDNVGLVREALETMDASGDQWRLFRYAWGAIDGPGAVEFASTLEGRDRARFLSESLSGWASAEPQAAMRWLDELPEGEERDGLQGSLVGGLADRDIGMATDYVYKLARDGNENAARYLEQVAGEQLRTSSVQNAASWAQNLPDGDLKGAALDTIGGRYVDEDPEAAAAWATQFAADPHGTRVVEEIGDEWAERDPQAAVAWLDTLPEGRGKEEGMQSALGEWTRRDPLAASEYLVSMPPSQTKDHAISGFARRLSSEDPVSAVAWAETIREDAIRNEALTRAAQQWMRRDADSAIQWLESSPLPPEAQEAILTAPQERGRRRG